MCDNGDCIKSIARPRSPPPLNRAWRGELWQGQYRGIVAVFRGGGSPGREPPGYSGEGPSTALGFLLCAPLCDGGESFGGADLFEGIGNTLADPKSFIIQSDDERFDSPWVAKLP